jgi:hypothetical protein
MRSIEFGCMLLGVGNVLAQTQYTSTGTSAIAKARATALTESPTSNIAGKTFNRFVTICKYLCMSFSGMILIFELGLENTDYATAAADGDLTNFISETEYLIA